MSDQFPEIESIATWPSNVFGASIECWPSLHNPLETWFGKTPEGFTAFAYLWRRFGPPWLESDDYKELCQYVLTTPIPSVYLTVYPTGSRCGMGFLADYARYLNCQRDPDSPDAIAVGDALRTSAMELLRPVSVRDVDWNILGRCEPWGHEEDDDWVCENAELSKYAGIGIPKAAMDKEVEECT